MRRLRKVPWFYNNPWREPEFGKIVWFPTLEKIIRQSVANSGRVLEVGCGHGMLSLELARNGLAVRGIDLSPRCIQVAEAFRKKAGLKKTDGHLEYACGDFLALELAPQSYNTIVFFRSLHHFPNFKAAVRKSHALLAPRGQIIICEPIRRKFTRESAQIALVLRTILPTWQSYDSKLNIRWDKALWTKKVDQIFAEYVYEGQHKQSALDNSVASDAPILSTIRRLFNVEYTMYGNAFVDKLIGGLRGKHRIQLARFLMFVDDYFVAEKLLPPTSITVIATKKCK